jgi:hypothetical protein
MRVCGRIGRAWAVLGFSFLVSLIVVLAASTALGQGAYEAQVRGTVTDPSGAVLTNATVTITNVGTNVAQTTTTNEHGEYFFTGLRPSNYTVKAQAQGFRIAEKTDVVLQVDQQTSVNFVLHPPTVSQTMEVTETAPLLDTESATLGTDISSEYVHELPLMNRSFFGLTFLAAGVTEVSGAGTSDNYPSGTNFTSNGQRNATAEIRLDGALLSAPEQGEGGNSNVYYEPLVEGMQEMKVQNNSFSAEFGNNGGTVVNMVMKSGTNSFHGSGWYFIQRPGIDARDFFNPKYLIDGTFEPKPDSHRDQGGFSLGGPIRKNKTFFFVDFEKVRSSSATSGVVTVPTMAERIGDFSADMNPDTNTPQNIYDPNVNCGTSDNVMRPQVGFDCSNNPIGSANQIPTAEQDPIGMAVLNLYPQPTNANEFNNYNYTTVTNGPDYQFDIKVDHQINDRNHINGRYSRGWNNFTTPLTLGDGFDNDGIQSGVTVAHNASLEYTWTVNPRIIWNSHVSLDRVHEVSLPSIPNISSFNASLPSGVQGLPAVYEQANGIDKMPTFLMQGNLPWTNLYDQCCINTTFAHTLFSYSSQLVISHGAHLIKLGGEQRIFYNNFWQPNYPTGFLTFTDDVTSPTPNSNFDGSGNTSGNPYASLAFGYADNINASSQLVVTPSVANRSLETGFYVQDDWKVNSKLTVNLGLRYQWSSPYTSRHNQIEFSNFAADSGVSLDLTSLPAAAQSQGAVSVQDQMGSIGLNYPASQELFGTTQFPTSSMRTVPTYRKDIGPRLGFSYQVDPQTVVRGGAGIYFGMSPATNFQYPGSAFRKTANFFFTNDNFATQSATLENPFPSGFTGPQGTQYGQLANWGYQNPNDLGNTAARDAELYQWNLGIQRLLPSQIVLGVDYSANRSTHLPWSGTNNRAYIPSPLLAQVSAAEHYDNDVTQGNGIGNCDQVSSCVSNFLATGVGNPFYGMFNSPCSPSASNPCFNEPNSNYGEPTLPLGTLLTKYPQFNGDFEGLMLETANSWYNAMQIRFQKRTTHHISFEGSYTISKETDFSSAGRNNWVGALGLGIPQQLDNLKAERSIGANDTPQRLAAAVVVDLPVGRKEWIGGNMNRGLDAVIGGWSIATLITEQSGQPMNIGMSTARLANGTQRPDVVCSQLKTGVSAHTVALNWQNAGNGNSPAFLNANCFADPGDQIPGNAPRYFSGLRVDGIHNADLNFYKSFVPKEGMRIELRAEMFNLFNHPRFAQPNSLLGDPLFGTITSDNLYGSALETPRFFQFGLRFEF